MADLQRKLEPLFVDAMRQALGEALAGADPDPLLRATQHAKFGDYQSNAAMPLAKKAKKNPREIAAQVIEALDKEALAALADKVEITGPGFVGVTFSRAALEGALAEAYADPRAGVLPAEAPEKVVLDYSSPNVAKEMHVGHLRSTVIGDSLARTLAFLGHEVVRHNHVGDWGTPFGMLIEHLIDLGTEEAAAALSMGELNAFYREARRKFEGDPAFAERSRERVVKLQGGDEETLALWRLLVEHSGRYFARIYERLGVLLRPEDVQGESVYNEALPEIASDLEARGIARVDEGALCAFPEGFMGREDKPLPLLVRKSGGGFGYAATDLAALRRRTHALGATRVIYVVGAPQAQHLSMVFQVARDAGYLPAGGRAEHAPFGSVLGGDKKMLKSRSGETVKLAELLDEAVERAFLTVTEKHPDWPEEERRAIAHKIGIGAIKYADLSSDRIKDYTFDWDRMLSMEGDTGPYLQYAHARIRSIFRKADEDKIPYSLGNFAIEADQERALALRILEFDRVVHAAERGLAPHLIANYLFRLANDFASFYEGCPVLKAEDEATRSARLSLCDLVAKVLREGLTLLGIEAPDRM